MISLNMILKRKRRNDVMAKDKDGFVGFHHGYLGLVLMLIGFILVFTPLPFIVSLITMILGLVIFLDDYYQHYKQRTNPDYQSWLHKLYVWAIRKMLKSKKFNWLGKLIVKVNGWYDKLFGRS